jgi:hypothetical protein
VKTKIFLALLWVAWAGSATARQERGGADELRPWGPPAARKSCAAGKSEAMAAFRKGLKAFEQKSWPEAISQLGRAAEYDCAGDLSGIALYGRWRYPFQPQVYLGLALSHLAECLTDCSRHCSAVDAAAPAPPAFFDPACTGRSVAGLAALPPSALREGCWQGRCAELSGEAQKVYSSPLDCPAADLFVALERSGFALDDAGIAAARGDCAEVSTPVDWLWQALTSERSDNELLCEETREELVAVAGLCREPRP